MVNQVLCVESPEVRAGPSDKGVACCLDMQLEGGVQSRLTGVMIHYSHVESQRALVRDTVSRYVRAA